jgi:outer membrane biosynthesis protein TonB
MMATVKMREYVSMELALAASLALHLLAYLCWVERDVLAHFTLFKPLVKVFSAPVWSPPKRALSAVPTITFLEEPVPKRNEQRTFMETDPEQATGEEPKDAKFYSERSTVAANPDNPTGQIGDTPYLDGKETRMMSTESVMPSPAPPAPAAVPPPPPKPVEPPKSVVEKPTEEPPKKLPDEGVTVAEEKKVAMLEKPAEPVMPILPPEPPAASPMPAGSHREIAAAKSRVVAVGVGRIGIAAFNVAGSPFGEYDKALIRAVQSRWYALISQNGLYERAGTVTLHFNLMQDGSVKDMEFKENSAGEILGLFCQKAVVDSAPFAPLPDNLRMLIGSDPREVNFTFYY